MLNNWQWSTQISFLPIQTTLPDSDKAEISLFGPGIGECIVLHIGEGKWFIIDSCRCPETKQPIALKYLNSIGVDVATQVIGILITHWHSDHIAGVFDLFKECKKAKLYQSSALTNKETYNLAAIFKKDIFSNTDLEIREFSEISQFLFESKERSRFHIVDARYTFFDIRNKIYTRMVALSPSNTAVTQAISNLVKLNIKDNSERLRNVLPVSENLNAVAIYFTFGDFSAILGSDLEEAESDLTGWSAIFKSNIIDELSLSLSSLFKVPHHGSVNGHHDDIWNKLLEDQPLSIATAYTRSGLPKECDIDRIKNRSSEFIVTRDSNASKKIKRDSMVEKELKSIVKSMKSINDKMGHIQVRVSHNGKLEIARSDSCVQY